VSTSPQRSRTTSPITKRMRTILWTVGAVITAFVASASIGFAITAVVARWQDAALGWWEVKDDEAGSTS
jgi:hypothetical protein